MWVLEPISLRGAEPYFTISEITLMVRTRADVSLLIAPQLGGSALEFPLDESVAACDFECEERVLSTQLSLSGLQACYKVLQLRIALFCFSKTVPVFEKGNHHPSLQTIGSDPEIHTMLQRCVNQGYPATSSVTFV